MSGAWMSNRVRMIDERHRVLIVVGCCILSFLATAMTLPENVQATNHGGWITADETWYKAGNPHIIVKDVRVMPSVTLTILQGVNVSFNLGTTLYVDGDLLVQGTGFEPVRFSSSSFMPQRGDWGSIHFNSSSGGGQPSSTIDEAIVEYGSSGIYVYNRSLGIRNCTIRENFVGIDSNIGALSVEASSIYNNTYDGINWTGWNSLSSLASISGNNITNNGGNGINGSAGAIVAISGNDISFNTYGIRFNDSTPATFQNDIFNNSEDGIHFLRSGNGTAISNNTVANNSKNGIEVDMSTVQIDNNTIDHNVLDGAHLANYSGVFENNTILDNSANGVSLADSSGPVLRYNNITSNGGNGISGSAGATVTITANNISYNKHGIHFTDSTPTTSQNNITHNSEDGIYFLRSGNGTSISHNTVADNSRNGMQVNTSWVIIDNNTIDTNGLNGTYLIDYNGTLENNTVLNNSGSGVYLVDSSGSFLQYNNITLNGIHGVYSYYSSLTIRENNITHNSPSGLCPPHCSYYGIYADHGSTLEIDHNRVENNTANGIRLYYATQVNFTDNIVSGHICSICYGIRTDGGQLGMLSNTMVDNDGTHIRIEEYQQPSRVENNTLVGGGSGIYLTDSGSSIMIANNTIRDLGQGMQLKDSAAKVYNNLIENLTNVGIFMVGDSNEDVFNNTITNAWTGVFLRVLSSEVGSPYILNNTITGGSNSPFGISIEGQGSATPIVKYNAITNHTDTFSNGIRITQSNAHPEIINNTISNNYYGIYLQDGANATVHGCNIYDNSHFGAFNDDETIEVNATENWWGDSLGPDDPSWGPPDRNPNDPGDDISDYIRYRWIEYGLWWLTSPAQW